MTGVMKQKPRLQGVTGRDGYIVAQALVYAILTIDALPRERRSLSNQAFSIGRTALERFSLHGTIQLEFRMDSRPQKPRLTQTRRNLLAGASVLVSALWSFGVQAHGRNHGHGHHHHHHGHHGHHGHYGHGGRGGHCFLAGTSIWTPSGEREISTLAVGDLVITHSGQEKPIQWIGRRSVQRESGKPWSRDVAPIRILRSALAEGVPHRDLYISPGHALYLDG